MYNFYALNSMVTEPNLTKFIQDVQKWLLIYSLEIKIVIFQSVLEHQGDEWRSLSNCGRIVAKIARFNSVDSKVIGRNFTKFVHDVAGLLPFNVLKVASWSSDSLSNTKVKTKGRSYLRLQTSYEFNWLP